MFRTLFTGCVLVALCTMAYGQQTPNENLFPTETLPNLGKTIKQGAEQTVQQVQQTTSNTMNTAKAAAGETAGSWTRFLQPKQPSSTTMIDRWNQGTKDFLNKTKRALTPPPIETPMFGLPSFSSGRSAMPSVKLPTLTTSDKKKTRSFLPSIFSREPEPISKPQTIQDWMGQDRPE